MKSNLDQKCSHCNLYILSISNIELILSITLYIMEILKITEGEMGSSGKALNSKNTLEGLKVDNVIIIDHENISVQR